jgi:hypothetical protein
MTPPPHGLKSLEIAAQTCWADFGGSTRREYETLGVFLFFFSWWKLSFPAQAQARKGVANLSLIVRVKTRETFFIRLSDDSVYMQISFQVLSTLVNFVDIQPHTPMFFSERAGSLLLFHSIIKTASIQ